MTTAVNISSSVVNLRKNLSDLISTVSFAGARVEVTRNGKSVAALVPSQDLERLQELELLVEGLAFNKAMEEDDGSRMSIDDFLAGKDFED